MRKSLASFALLAISATAGAQQAPLGGAQLQQIPVVPAPPAAPPAIRIEQGAEAGAPAAGEAADAARISVQSLQLINQHAFSEARLLAVAGFQPGSRLSLAQLRAMAARITDFYRAQGYFLARAYLPAQDVKDGKVTIAVLEGQYGKIKLRNASGMDDSVAHSLLDGLHAGDAVLIGPLESRLLLLSDLPGVRVQSTLVPGAAPGSTDLLVDLAPGPRYNGSIDADNHGNRYTGRARVGATLNVNQLAGQGDVLSARVLSSAAGLNYGRLAYQAQVGKASAGAAYTSMVYHLGQDFEDLQAHGTARIASLFGSYPLRRSRDSNLAARVELNAKTFRDRQDVAAIVTDKKATVLVATLSGDQRDRFGAGGVTRFALSWSAGRIAIDSPLALATDSLTARTNGRFDKLGFSLSRLQELAPSLALYGALNGQLASGNLDASEKMGLGGASAVRGYPEGEAYADRGAVATLELRRALPANWQLTAFADAGRATLDKNPWNGPSQRRTLSAAGLGLDWSGGHGLVVKAYAARKLGSEVARSAPDARYRFWIDAVKYF